MDPLSISAAVIAFLGAANATFRAISNVRNVRSELCGLLNEITDINLVLCHASDLVQSADSTNISSATHEHLLKLCTDGKDKIDQIRTHVDDVSGGPAGKEDDDARQSISKHARMKWIKKKRAINDLRDELRELRHNITACVGEMTRYVRITQTILRWTQNRFIVLIIMALASICDALSWRWKEFSWSPWKLACSAQRNTKP